MARWWDDLPWQRVLGALLVALAAGGGVEGLNRHEVGQLRTENETLEQERADLQRQRDAMSRGWVALKEQREALIASLRTDNADLRSRNRELVERLIECASGETSTSIPPTH